MRRSLTIWTTGFMCGTFLALQYLWSDGQAQLAKEYRAFKARHAT